MCILIRKVDTLIKHNYVYPTHCQPATADLNINIKWPTVKISLVQDVNNSHKPLEVNTQIKLELVYLPEGKYWVYPRIVYRLAIVMPPG